MAQASLSPCMHMCLVLSGAGVYATYISRLSYKCLPVSAIGVGGQGVLYQDIWMWKFINLRNKDWTKLYIVCVHPYKNIESVFFFIFFQVNTLLHKRFVGAGKNIFLGVDAAPPLVFATKNIIFRGGSWRDPPLQIHI